MTTFDKQPVIMNGLLNKGNVVLEMERQIKTT